MPWNDRLQGQLNSAYAQLCLYCVFWFFLMISFICIDVAKAVIPSIYFKDVTKQFGDASSAEVHYSPLFGKVGLDSGLIYNLRFYGNIDFAYDKKDSSKRIYANDKGNDGVMTLLIALFPSTGGQLASSSEAQTNFGKIATIENVASMLKYCYHVRNFIENNPNANLPNSLIDNKVPLANMIVKSIQSEYVSSNGESTTMLLSGNQMAKIYHQTKHNKSGRTSQQLQSKIDNNTYLKPLLSQSLADYKKQVRSNQTQLRIETQFYPKYMTEEIISSFFVHHWDKQENINQLITYMNQKQFPLKLNAVDASNNGIWTAKLVTEFDQSGAMDLDYVYISTWEHITKPVPYRQGNPIANNGNCPYVKIDETNNNRKVIADTKSTFPDCVETTIRHFCNIIFYDARSNSFQLPSNVNNEDLREYYNKYEPKDADGTSSELRGQWNLVVGALPNVRYLRDDDMNEVDCGFQNFLNVLFDMFGIDLLSHAEFKIPNNKDETEQQFEKVIQFMNPKLIVNQTQINNFRNDKDVFGDLMVAITNEDGISFSFVLDSALCHDEMRNINYKTYSNSMTEYHESFEKLYNNDAIVNHVLQRKSINVISPLFALFGQNQLMHFNQKLDYIQSVTKSFQLKQSHFVIIENIFKSFNEIEDHHNLYRDWDNYNLYRYWDTLSGLCAAQNQPQVAMRRIEAMKSKLCNFPTNDWTHWTPCFEFQETLMKHKCTYEIIGQNKINQMIDQAIANSTTTQQNDVNHLFKLEGLIGGLKPFFKYQEFEDILRRSLNLFLNAAFNPMRMRHSRWGISASYRKMFPSDQRVSDILKHQLSEYEASLEEKWDVAMELNMPSLLDYTDHAAMLENKFQQISNLSGEESIYINEQFRYALEQQERILESLWAEFVSYAFSMPHSEKDLDTSIIAMTREWFVAVDAFVIKRDVFTEDPYLFRYFVQSATPLFDLWNIEKHFDMTMLPKLTFGLNEIVNCRNRFGKGILEASSVKVLKMFADTLNRAQETISFNSIMASLFLSMTTSCTIEVTQRFVQYFDSHFNISSLIQENAQFIRHNFQEICYFFPENYGNDSDKSKLFVKIYNVYREIVHQPISDEVDAKTIKTICDNMIGIRDNMIGIRDYDIDSDHW